MGNAIMVNDGENNDTGRPEIEIIRPDGHSRATIALDCIGQIRQMRAARFEILVGLTGFTAMALVAEYWLPALLASLLPPWIVTVVGWIAKGGVLLGILFLCGVEWRLRQLTWALRKLGLDPYEV